MKKDKYLEQIIKKSKYYKTNEEIKKFIENKNFLNSQNYILGKKVKKKIIINYFLSYFMDNYLICIFILTLLLLFTGMYFKDMLNYKLIGLYLYLFIFIFVFVFYMFHIFLNIIYNLSTNFISIKFLNKYRLISIYHNNIINENTFLIKNIVKTSKELKEYFIFIKNKGKQN